ncbi:FIT family protein CG10671 [Copidosoma floridanum]|uniref:FIT family protein CG10671 n=1 Tax=Copidosoma floridanum TaxID=29053 RepID=UPI0006C9D90F|nr:FIT family protein CG10671 [Copidosoma floridanum]
MSKRKSIHSAGGLPSSSAAKNNVFTTNFNFRPNSTQEDRGGTRPIAAPSSVSLVLVTMILHICKKSLLYDPRLKAVIYFAAIFVGSIIADVVSVPNTYFAKSNNFLNRFFIKWAWGWLLATAAPWIILTAHTIGCGRRSILIKHLVRLAFATAAWMLWMNIFRYVETNYGRCLGTRDRGLHTKSKCLQAGQFWSSIDISGHAFIIIYSSLILSEEGYSLLGWEGIKNLIMNEEYNRKSSTENTTGCLRNLSDIDLNFLKKAYEALTPYLRGLFIAMTIQQVIWDVMLVATILYYHIMIEKFMGGVAAILTWYVSYYWLFRLPLLGMVMPGEGIFKYNELKEKNNIPKPKRSLSNRGPTFMGMPIKTCRDELEKNDSKTRDVDTELIYRRN